MTKRIKIGEIRQDQQVLDVVEEPTGEVSIVADPVDTYASLEDLREALSPGYEFHPIPAEPVEGDESL